jgi:hypothetical protein
LIEGEVFKKILKADKAFRHDVAYVLSNIISFNDYNMKVLRQKNEDASVIEALGEMLTTVKDSFLAQVCQIAQPDETETEISTSRINFIVGKFSNESQIESRYFTFQRGSKTRISTKVNYIFEKLKQAQTPLSEFCVQATFYKTNPVLLKRDQIATVSKYSAGIIETNITDSEGSPVDQEVWNVAVQRYF